jgi:hypothetical protein
LTDWLSAARTSELVDGRMDGGQETSAEFLFFPTDMGTNHVTLEWINEQVVSLLVELEHPIRLMMAGIKCFSEPPGRNLNNINVSLARPPGMRGHMSRPLDEKPHKGAILQPN